jgi:hypothetical protein
MPLVRCAAALLTAVAAEAPSFLQIVVLVALDGHLLVLDVIAD